jgi:acyl-coenzyme A synthetase/AMP-(fatty) acid ligase
MNPFSVTLCIESNPVHHDGAGVKTLSCYLFSPRPWRHKTAAGSPEEGSLGRVGVCISAGEALPAEILKRWKARFGVGIMDGIGSTEISPIFISNRVNDMRSGSTGKLVPGY